LLGLMLVDCREIVEVSCCHTFAVREDTCTGSKAVCLRGINDDNFAGLGNFQTYADESVDFWAGDADAALTLRSTGCMIAGGVRITFNLKSDAGNSLTDRKGWLRMREMFVKPAMPKNAAAAKRWHGSRLARVSRTM
jgi:hypothetical protein